MGKTLFRKLLVAFAIGFIPVFVGGLTNALDAVSGGEAEWNFVGGVLVSLAAGAVSAGLRAMIAVWTNFEPGDEIHGSGPPDSVTVTTKGTVGPNAGEK